MNTNRLRSILSDFKNGHSDAEQTIKLIEGGFQAAATDSPTLLLEDAENIILVNLNGTFSAMKPKDVRDGMIKALRKQANQYT